MNIDDWLVQESQEGTLHSHGRFTRDLEKAKAKLGRYQLESGLYLAKWLQAGVLAQASQAELTLCGKVVVKLHFPELPSWTVEELIVGLENPLGAEPDAPMTALVQGILAACNSRGRVRYQDSRGQRLEIVDGEVSLDPTKLDPAQSKGWVALTVDGANACNEEKIMLGLLCGYCPMPIRVFGSVLDCAWADELKDFRGYQYRLGERFVSIAEVGRGLGLNESDPEWCHRTYKVGSQPWHLGIAVCEFMEGPSKVHWVRHGVVVETELLDLGCPGSVAVVDASKLPTDLTQFKLRREDAFREKLQELRTEQQKLLRDIQSERDKLKIPNGSRVLQESTAIGLGTAVLCLFGAILLPGYAMPCMLLGCTGMGSSTLYYLNEMRGYDAQRTREVLESLEKLEHTGSNSENLRP